MKNAAVAHVRIARPTTDLPAAERFWTEGAGATVLWRNDTDAMLAVGFPGASWHLELVEDGSTRPAPTEEDLLVLYLGSPATQGDLDRLVAAGGEVVVARNPYWDRWGTTVADPDGYRLVLSHRTWT